MKVAIDIGHGLGADMGAVSSDGLSEHGYWVEHAGKIRDRLVALGHRVFVFQRSDYGGIAGEIRAINSYGVDCVVSLHLNSADSRTCKGGHEVVYFDGSRKGRLLALDIDRELDRLPGLEDRNVRVPYNGRGDAFLSGTVAPAVIVEAGFLSVEGDVRFLREYAEAICGAIAAGVHSWFLRV